MENGAPPRPLGAASGAEDAAAPPQRGGFVIVRVDAPPFARVPGGSFVTVESGPYPTLSRALHSLANPKHRPHVTPDIVFLPTSAEAWVVDEKVRGRPRLVVTAHEVAAARGATAGARGGSQPSSRGATAEPASGPGGHGSSAGAERQPHGSGPTAPPTRMSARRHSSPGVYGSLRLGERGSADVPDGALAGTAAGPDGALAGAAATPDSTLTGAGDRGYTEAGSLVGISTGTVPRESRPIGDPRLTGERRSAGPLRASGVAALADETAGVSGAARPAPSREVDPSREAGRPRESGDASEPGETPGSIPSREASAAEGRRAVGDEAYPEGRGASAARPESEEEGRGTPAEARAPGEIDPGEGDPGVGSPGVLGEAEAGGRSGSPPALEGVSTGHRDAHGPARDPPNPPDPPRSGVGSGGSPGRTPSSPPAPASATSPAAPLTLAGAPRAADARAPLDPPATPAGAARSPELADAGPASPSPSPSPGTSPPGLPAAAAALLSPSPRKASD